MKRLLIVIAGVLAVVALGAAPAGAATLDSCLAQHHVCVSDSGRQVISTAQKDQLEKQIGNEPIYLVVATSGSAGYASAETLADLSPQMDELFLSSLRELAAPRLTRG